MEQDIGAVALPPCRETAGREGVALHSLQRKDTLLQPGLAPSLGGLFVGSCYSRLDGIVYRRGPSSRRAGNAIPPSSSRRLCSPISTSRGRLSR